MTEFSQRYHKKQVATAEETEKKRAEDEVKKQQAEFQELLQKKQRIADEIEKIRIEENDLLALKEKLTAQLTEIKEKFSGDLNFDEYEELEQKEAFLSSQKKKIERRLQQIQAQRADLWVSQRCADGRFFQALLRDAIRRLRVQNYDLFLHLKALGELAGISYQQIIFEIFPITADQKLKDKISDLKIEILEKLQRGESV